MVIVTKLLYEMRFIVNNRQEPYGCGFSFLRPACCIYIHEIYCNGEGRPWWWCHGPWCQAGGMMEIIPRRTRWRSIARRTISYHIIYEIYCNGEGRPWWWCHGPWCQAGGMMEIIPRRTRWRSIARRTISYHIIH